MSDDEYGTHVPQGVIDSWDEETARDEVDEPHHTNIDVSERTRERFDELKRELHDAEPGIPPATDDGLVNSLIDTWERVGKLGYGEDDD